MTRPVAAALALSGATLLTGLVDLPAVASTARDSTALRADPQVYRAIGTIRSFGPDRAYVNIAHDDIPGYMSAMTMSFWPQHKEKLDGLVVGDAVVFEFTEAEDARRILSSIRKR